MKTVTAVTLMERSRKTRGNHVTCVTHYLVVDRWLDGSVGVPSRHLYLPTSSESQSVEAAIFSAEQQRDYNMHFIIIHRTMTLQCIYYG